MKQRVIRPDIPLAVLGQSKSSGAPGNPLPDSKDAGQPTHSPAFIGQNQVSGSEKIISIPLPKLRVSPYNARKVRTPKRVSRIAESLKANGQKDPLYVYPGVGDDSGYFMVLGGETRRLGALQIAMPDLLAFVDYEIDPANALALTKTSTILNDSADECDLDRGMVAIDLLAKGHSQTEVAEVLDLESHTHVQRLQKLASLPKRFIDFGQDYPERFSASLGAYISQALDKHGEDFAFNLLKAALVDEMTHRKIAQAIEAGPSNRSESPQRGKRLRRDGGFDIPAGDAPGGRYDVYKSKTPGQKVLRLQVEMSDELANALNEQLTEVLTQFIQKSKTP